LKSKVNSHLAPNHQILLSYQLSEQHKLALIGTNILNRSYSLRPLKIEAPRAIMVQYTWKLEGKSKQKPYDVYL
jgi:hypothetical protein